MKSGFYFKQLDNDLGTILALVYPDNQCEKIYIGNDPLLTSFILSDEWYDSFIFGSNWEYIGL